MPLLEAAFLTLATATAPAMLSPAPTTRFSDYPAFVKPNAVVQAYTDKGPIVEMIVRCPEGSGIMSYSKIERLYCSAKHTCFLQLREAVSDTCR
jgi:hypothetical protein